jgi:hypothetical protein
MKIIKILLILEFFFINTSPLISINQLILANKFHRLKNFKILGKNKIEAKKYFYLFHDLNEK